MRNTSKFVVPVALVSFVALGLSLAACGGKIAGDGRSSSGGDPTDNGATSAGSTSGATPGGSSSGGPGLVFPPAATSTSDQPSPSSSTSTTGGLVPPGSAPSIDNACAAICARNAQCGADTPDCQESCSSEIHGASGCAPEANDYIQCYASNLASGCAELPPVCEKAYCTYTICTGKVVPDYCGSR